MDTKAANALLQNKIRKLKEESGEEYKDLWTRSGVWGQLEIIKLNFDVFYLDTKTEGRSKETFESGPIPEGITPLREQTVHFKVKGKTLRLGRFDSYEEARTEEGRKMVRNGNNYVIDGSRTTGGTILGKNVTAGIVASKLAISETDAFSLIVTVVSEFRLFDELFQEERRAIHDRQTN